MTAEPKKTSLRGKYIPAIDPEDGSNIEILIPQRRVQWARRNGKGAIRELATSVATAVHRPQKAYEGIRHEYDNDESPHAESDGWRCYVGGQGRGHNYITGRVIDKSGQVLLVFVNQDAIIYNHRWEKEDPDKPGCPIDADRRFTRELL